jgi:hypothetical protein
VKFVMTVVVRDNADVVEANIRYHLAQGVDLVIATDNGSEDGTVEILERFARRGLVHLLHRPPDEFDHAGWVTHMARLAAVEHGADWVINNDADELWWPKEGTLKDVFAGIPREFGLLGAPRVNFVVRPEDGRHCFGRMTLRDVRSYHRENKPIPPNTAHRGCAEIEVAFGSHQARGPGLVPLPRGTPIHVFHYPVRSYAQFERKMRNAGQILRGDPDRPGAQAAHAWRRGHRHMLAGTLRQFYDEHVVDDAAAAAGIAEGKFVLDRRAATFLRDRELLDGPALEGERFDALSTAR